MLTPYPYLQEALRGFGAVIENDPNTPLPSGAGQAVGSTQTPRPKSCNHRASSTTRRDVTNTKHSLWPIFALRPPYPINPESHKPYHDDQGCPHLSQARFGLPGRGQHGCLVFLVRAFGGQSQCLAWLDRNYYQGMA